MGAFFIYIFKSAVCLALFYLFFRLLLSKETFHRFNRIALLGVLCLSWLVPLIEITTSHQMEVNQAVLTIEQLLMMAEGVATNATVDMAEHETVSFPWIHIALLIYLAGILFFICHHLYSLGCLVKLLFSGKREKLEKGTILIIHEKEVAPFSWMKYIVIRRKDIEENGREILIHEMAHIRNRHSIDLLVADICIFFQWFNPGAWLLKQELQNIHEYEADESVISEGVNAKEYQLLLIKKAVGTRLYSMANSFNHSKLKKRITMMLKEKSNPWARMKYLYVLPLAAVAVTAFARPEVSETVDEISAVKVNDLAAIVATETEENVVEVPKDTIKAISLTKITKVAQDTVDAVKIVEYGSTKGLTVKGTRHLIIIDDKESDFRVLNAIDPACIESITVMKPEAAMKIYGEKGKNGVMFVKLYPKDKVVQQSVPELSANVKARIGTLLGERITTDLGAGIMLGSRDLQPGSEPLVLVDGKEVYGEKPLSKIAPDRIRSLCVLKDKAALDTYGERGKNGVILVSVFTDEEYQYRKDHPEKPYYDVLEMAMCMKVNENSRITPEDLVFIVDGKPISTEDAKKVLAEDVDDLKFVDQNGKTIVNIHTKKK